MKTLNHRQITVARAVGSALFDDGTGGLPEERLDFALRELRLVIARAGWQTRLAFHVACLVIQLSPLLLFQRLSRFSRLGLSGRQALLRRLERSKLGLVVVLLKTTLCMVYFEHPDVLAETGYDGDAVRVSASDREETTHLPILPVPPQQQPARVAGGAPA